MSELLEFARRYTEAWCSGEPALVAEHYSTDGSLTINGGSPAIGREAITEAARGFMDGFPDLGGEMDQLKTGGGSPQDPSTLTGTKTGRRGTRRARGDRGVG